MIIAAYCFYWQLHHVSQQMLPPGPPFRWLMWLSLVLQLLGWCPRQRGLGAHHLLLMHPLWLLQLVDHLLELSLRGRILLLLLILLSTHEQLIRVYGGDVICEI